MLPFATLSALRGETADEVSSFLAGRGMNSAEISRTLADVDQKGIAILANQFIPAKSAKAEA